MAAQPHVEQKWPQWLYVVRHGQSAGNVARERAEAAGHHLIDIAARDMDVPLSPLGEQQADAVGRWFGQLPAGQQPNVVLCSPYVRAQATAERLLAAAGIPRSAITFERDERLREKEFGILDRLTVLGIRQKYPELAEQRAHVGKFYFRPPGGESWCDVILRLRSVIEMITREHRRERVLVVAHQVTVNCMRYLIECKSEAEILDIDRQADVPNCGVTGYEYDPGQGPHGKLVPRLVNFVSPLTQAGAPVTAEPDVPVAPKP
ncbi:histidine phosphatase family protein [Piscinibacter gummiphilus]|uniref:phosphoglycerate mutase (2,3-diphosphoglycerate-dependent) n=1 Tax=Piscinibacter gummiphilus TaxID=946333 RepID=A0ABZ0D236_9BURK|nr:histidine phosphatase family protein [Piscinibacter gummiphilus]WOB09375.1 histidine phosphatase family protein [Piscinibacter gummiphilus]